MDWWTVSLYLILVVTGWFSIYAASYDFDVAGIFDPSGRSGKQLMWIGVSFIAIFLLLLIDSDWYDIFSYWFYIIVVLLLIFTIFLARDIKGSYSWLEIGPITIQPAEFSKFATALAVAKTMSSYRFNLKKIENFVKVLALIFLPMLLILMQKETGSALVFLAFSLMLFREGMSGYVLFVGFCAILFFILGIKYGDTLWLGTSLGSFIVLTLIILMVNGLLYVYKKGKTKAKISTGISLTVLLLAMLIFPYFQLDLTWAALAVLLGLLAFILYLFLNYRASTYLFIFLVGAGSVTYHYSTNYFFNKLLEPHQRIRIQVSLNMLDDPSGAGYNVKQSKIAIGSGGFSGKGYLNGTQTKLKYVPEQDTDFIFCTIGEERGFVGSTAVMLLFLVFILRLIYLAERQKSTFSRIYGYCVLSVFFFHLAINVGMVLGITPVIGIPLPFFSYGGSSLLAFTILLFIFLRLDASRKDRL